MDVVQRIREKQAGFRAEIGLNIFVFTNIVEQCIEQCNVRIFSFNFVDFRKIFNRIHRDIMRHYGLLQKIFSLIKLIYELY